MNNEVSNNSNNELNVKSNNNSKIIIVILVILLIGALGFICYDKFINKEKPPVSTPISNPGDNDSNSEKITTLKRIQLSDVDQIANVDGKEFKIKKEVTVDGAFLLIDDAVQYVWDLETAYAEFAYVTNKYIIFTVNAQDWETITYAIDKEGNQISVDDVNKEGNEKGEDERRYQIHDLKIVDGKLQASGHLFCGIDGDCPDIDLMLNYENNIITVAPKK